VFSGSRFRSHRIGPDNTFAAIMRRVDIVTRNCMPRP
jgi:hypothetical protein